MFINIIALPGVLRQLINKYCKQKIVGLQPIKTRAKLLKQIFYDLQVVSCVQYDIDVVDILHSCHLTQNTTIL